MLSEPTAKSEISCFRAAACVGSVRLSIDEEELTHSLRSTFLALLHLFVLPIPSAQKGRKHGGNTRLTSHNHILKKRTEYPEKTLVMGKVP